LRNLDHEVGRTTIKRILAANGIEPATRGCNGMSWETFLKVHWGAIAASDFFTVEALTRTGMVRFLVFFVIDLRSRRVKIAGIAPDPDGRWMKQMARNLTDAEDGFLVATRYLIHDLGPLFTAEFRQILRHDGVKSVKLPAQSPDLNAYAERFVRSIREECLSRVIALGGTSSSMGREGVREALPPGEEPPGARE
jgi:putative transposase